VILQPLLPGQCNDVFGKFMHVVLFSCLATGYFQPFPHAGTRYALAAG
jgi:hypothetical protein